jgi:hypothetical protein
MLQSASVPSFPLSVHDEPEFDAFCARILSAYGRTADDISDSMVIKCASALLFVSCCALVDLPFLCPNRNSHISPFLFTKTLLPVMKKTALEPGSDVRIVNVCVVCKGDGIPQLTRIGIICGAPVGTESAV